MNNGVTTFVGRGRPRKPSALRTNKTKAQQQEALRGVVDVPPAPEGRGPWEIKAWEQARQIVNPLRVYTAADAIAFAQLVTNLAMILEAEAALREHGLTCEGSQGVKQRPEVQVILSAQKNLWYGLGRFGLSPSDRSRVEGAAPLTDAQRGRLARVAEFGG